MVTLGKVELEEIRQTLLAERARLQEQLEDAESSGLGRNPDRADLAIDYSQREQRTALTAIHEEQLAGIQADLGALIKAETQWSVEQLIAERITQGVQPQLRQLEQKMSQSLAELRQHQLDAREELLGERVPQLLNELEARQQQCLDELRQGFSQMPLDHAELTATVEDTVAAETAGLRVQLTEFIKTEIQRSIEHLLGELLINGVRPQIEQLEEGWRNAFSELCHELLCSQDQVLELRIPQLLQELERRQQQRMDDQYLSLIEGVREAAAVLGRLGR